jgi:hypothetical protein
MPLAAGAGPERQQTPLSEREITVLRLLPSLLSLDEEPSTSRCR